MVFGMANGFFGYNKISSVCNVDVAPCPQHQMQTSDVELCPWHEMLSFVCAAANPSSGIVSDLRAGTTYLNWQPKV